MIFKKGLALLAALMVCASFALAEQKSKSKKSTGSKAAAKTQQKAHPQESTATPASPSTTQAAPATDAEVERITVDELKAKITNKEPVVIIDSRSQGSYDSSDIKIKGAIRIPMDEVQARMKELPRDKEIVVYCT
ncbi:MAG TPA: rhodanese-like domain-containing protein [Blastocatellia bacterium]|nr:rhodanese-like domain-containing protein [Blastocatellia bacterium]